MKKKTEKVDEVKKEQQNTTIPISSVPHLYNADMLTWQKAQFNALKAIYDKLDEILISNKKE